MTDSPASPPAEPPKASPASPGQELRILGITKDGKTFRPSDWAERLAGVMAPFHPDAGPGRQIGYSPWCVPRTDGEVKCVVVNRALRQFNVMAWDFAVNFARDNNLQVIEG